MVTRVKGTQDFLDMRLFNGTVELIKRHLTLYHFHEIMTPILEHTELFKRSLGLETDVVSKEMFTLTTNDQEPDALCLRPEMTAAFVRAFIENNVESTPWKVFSVGPLFRHERPQKGRYRQFFQCNIEIIGAESLAQDALFVAMLDHFFSTICNVRDYALHLNFLGCFNDRKAYTLLLQEFLANDPLASGICGLCQQRQHKNILRIFDCKNAACQAIYTKAPKLTENLCTPCNTEWKTLQKDLDLLSISYSIRSSLVRGLDYYNKTVFEFVSDSLGAQSAFCGGGRYDQLAVQLGARQDYPSIGAAIGIERLLLLLEPLQETLCLPQLPPLHVIMPLALEQQSLALLIADELAANGICIDLLAEPGSVKSMMRKANKMGATVCLLIGEREQQERSVTVKNMITGNEQLVLQGALVDFLKKK